MRLINHKEIDITPWCIRLQPAAAVSEELQQFQDDKGRIDFSDSDSLNAYNKAAFKVMAGIDLTIPEKNLVPTACLRQAYLTILSQELLPRGSRILEIGTGATAVISMLAAKNHGYKVVATEIDPESIVYARKNIEQNRLQNEITLIQSQGGIIEEILQNLDPEIRLDAVLCYPPTYPEDDRRQYQDPEKITGFKGTESEMIGGGKEGYDFIEKYIDEAVHSNIKYITILLIFEIHADLAEKQLKDNNKHVHRIELKAGTRSRYLIIAY